MLAPKKAQNLPEVRRLRDANVLYSTHPLFVVFG